MKKVVIMMVAVTFFVLPKAMAQNSSHDGNLAKVSAHSEMNLADARQEKTNVIYRCPMHPEETSTKPGKCPKCGMNMVESGKSISYKCPMHPEEVSDKPGKCPRCQRTMVPSRFEGGNDYK